MPKATDISLKDVTISFEPLSLRAPLPFGERTLSKSLLVNVEVVAESRDGKRHATGYGSMPVGNLWAWPSTQLAPEQTEAAMKSFAEQVVDLASRCNELDHPFELVYHISAEYDHLAKQLSARMKLSEPIPYLAQLVAASPFDAAMHDAFGRVNNINSYDGLSAKYLPNDLASYLDKSFAGDHLDQYVQKQPLPRTPVYHHVAWGAPLTQADIQRPIGDGLPETLGDWIASDGLTHLRIELMGKDIAADVERVLAVDAVASQSLATRQNAALVYGLDLSEGCENVDAVLAFLKLLRDKNAAAFDRVQYVEQPFARAAYAQPDRKVDAIAKLKPVVIDESLTDYDSLLTARDQGYNGVALRACKGQTDTLLIAAACQKFGLFLCVQDLHGPGLALLQGASLAARIPTVVGLETQGRQYCPVANKPFAKLFPSMFDVADGSVETAVLNGVGLGF